MRNRFVVVAAALLMFAVAGVRGEGLSVGDAAPKLAFREFVKGEKVDKFDKGKIYVVEFWATWCGPCRVTIPHLTELQKKHKAVTFIGVSVFEREPDKVKPFVEEMGDKMDYRVAMDAVPAMGTGNDGFMAKNWMIAAGQEGIPTAFIVNGDGLINWIGHPAQMDEPLAKIIDGKYDVKVAAAEFKKAQAQKAKMRELQLAVGKAMQAKDYKAAVEAVDKAIADDEKLETMIGGFKFNTMAKLDGSEAKMLEYGKHLVTDVYKDNAQQLNNVAWTIVDPQAKKADAKMLKLALQAAQRADELQKGKDGAIADTLARAYFMSGDAAKALETQERAVKLTEGTPIGKDPGIKDRLEEYRKAAKKEK
jgi:thiol-disulfide isomerase/thioredoxin